jgi:hypothetical protein
MRVLMKQLFFVLVCATVAHVGCGGSAFVSAPEDGGAGGSGNSSGTTGGSGSSSGGGSGSSSGASSSGGGSGSSSGASSSGSGSGGSTSSSGGSTSSSGSSGGGGSSGSSSGGTSSGSSADAGTDAGAGEFACGQNLECDGRTSYCEETLGGVVVPDAASTGGSFSCQALPKQCLLTHTCKCLETYVAGIGQCSVSDGDLTATEDVP